MSGECSNCESRQRRGNDPRCLVCIYFNPAIFNKGFTEKENHTGIGLWEVRKILSKNNNINLFTSKTDDLFKQQLEIYLN